MLPGSTTWEHGHEGQAQKAWAQAQRGALWGCDRVGPDLDRVDLDLLIPGRESRARGGLDSWVGWAERWPYKDEGSGAWKNGGKGLTPGSNNPRGCKVIAPPQSVSRLLSHQKDVSICREYRAVVS